MTLLDLQMSQGVSIDTDFLGLDITMFESCLKAASADLASCQEGLLFPLALTRFQEIGQELSYFLTSRG